MSSWDGGSTSAWRRIRQFILDRDGHRCTIQLNVCTGVATQVHHRLGRAISGDSNSELLQAACQPCNRAIGQPKINDAPINRMTEW